MTSRRRFLTGAASAALMGAPLPGMLGTPEPPHAGHDGGPAHGGSAHGGGINGPTFRDGETVDHEANGFDPDAILRDFDLGA
ncbi:twin-arginine translocation signal domain-containing protein, partial [Pseudonocardia sp.]|uniref:twin-arginine translocation signal domain-containing protein n=1 Tax=Pseudonocardia sp. TaxID=60912 RepID=UPI003D1017B1